MDGEQDKAFKYLKAFLEGGHDPVPDLKAAKVCLLAGSPETAEEVFLVMDEKRGKLPTFLSSCIHLGRAWLYLDFDTTEKARHELVLARETGEDLWDLDVLEAEILESKKQFSKSLELLKKALRKAVNNPSPYDTFSYNIGSKQHFTFLDWEDEIRLRMARVLLRDGKIEDAGKYLDLIEPKMKDDPRYKLLRESGGNPKI